MLFTRGRVVLDPIQGIQFYNILFVGLRSVATKSVSIVLFTETKPNLVERFIGSNRENVELFFNLFTSGIETFVIPWEQRLYPAS